MRHPERWPEIGEPVEGTVGHRLVLALERGVPVLDFRRDLHCPALAHGPSIAQILYRVHAISGDPELPSGPAPRRADEPHEAAH